MVAATYSDGRCRHLALLYRGRDEYIAALCSFIQASRERGGALFVAVPQRNAQLVPQELGDGTDVTLADMAELGRNPARIIPALLAFADKHRGRHVCCIGEPIWPGRTRAEMREAFRHEALVNLAFRDSPVTVVCPYDNAGLPGAVITDAVRTHPTVIENHQATASVRYLRPPELPPRCNRSLSRPPPHAKTLGYSNDLSAVRGFVASRAGHAGLAPPRISDLVLAVGELAANTVRHTDGDGTVQVWQTAGEVICQVADTGQFTDPLAWHQAPANELPGGKGLWLVNQVCDLVQVRTGQAGTVIRLHMRLRRPSSRRARNGKGH